MHLTLNPACAARARTGLATLLLTISTLLPATGAGSAPEAGGTMRGKSERAAPAVPNAAGIPAQTRFEVGGIANALLGSATNDAPACQTPDPGGSCAFPTGVVGYGALRSPGNTVFGLFGRADCYTVGICTNEVNAFNFVADAPSYPWSRSFGGHEAVPVALTVAAGGTHPSAAGIEIAAEGSQPVHFHYGMVIRAGSVTGSGLLMDADPSQGPRINLTLRNSGGEAHRFLDLQTVGPARPDDPILEHRDADGRPTLTLTHGGAVIGLGGLQGARVVARSENYPVLATHNTAAGPDAQIWEWLAQGSTFVLRAVNDAYDAATTALTLTRKGAVVTGLIISTPLTVEAPLQGQFLAVKTAPTAADIPAGRWTVVKRSDDGSVRLCANNGQAVLCTRLER